MCAIVDANVANEVFGPNPTPAGERFLDWIDRGSSRLVAGGRLLGELEKGSPDFRKWTRQAVRTGKMRILDESEVHARIGRIERQRLHSSNDPHVLAVAQLSGARLLYSNDGNLQQDFKNRGLIDNPQGTVYSTREKKASHVPTNDCSAGPTCAEPDRLRSRRPPEVPLSVGAPGSSGPPGRTVVPGNG